MPEAYNLDLEGVLKRVQLYVWTYGENWKREYRGIFLHDIRAYQITVRTEDSRLFTGEICTDTEVVAVSGGAYLGEIMDEKLNESWKEYVKRYEAELKREWERMKASQENLM